MSDIEDTDAVSGDSRSHSREMAKEHAKQIQRLSETDPEFYQYLKEHDKELLDFNDEDIDEDEGTELEDDKESQPAINEAQKPLQKVITAAMVDSWCQATKEKKIGAVRSLLRAFRTACHYGDDSGNDSNTKFSVISSSVFNKIMVFVLNEMDGILRGLLEAPSSGGKKETIMELTTTKLWNKYGSLMKLYLGNALHILTQMTDEQMISFTLKRVKASAVFLAAFPALLRKYIKVALHSWGTGRGALPVVSFLFLRDLCVRLGSDCLDTCLKGVYKAYVMNCKVAKSVSISKLQHINFLGNCVTELYGVDLPSAYQHAFIFIRQLAEILRNALTERGVKTLVKDKTKGKQEGSKNTKQQVSKAHQKVYDWQFIGCLELWTQVICAYNSEADFRPLAYPLTQIISGVASLVPTARYFPLMLRCVRMLNRLAGATSTFIPVSALLLDMLDMKELNRLPTGGVGKAINLLTVKQVDKTTLKTRLFQEACVYSVIEELAEHLAQWSYAVSFFELSFVPLVQLRSFCKSTNVDKFRREVKELVRQIEANSEFTNSRRLTVDFSPNDPATESFLKADKESGSSPLSKFVADLRRRAQQRKGAMVESSVLVGAESSVFGSKLPEIEEEDEDNAEDGVAVFSSSWLPEKKSKSQKEKPKSKPSKKRHRDPDRIVDGDEDVVADLVLSSDDDDDSSDDEMPNIHSPDEDEHNSEDTPLKHEKKHKKQKLANSTKQEAKNKKSVTASSGKRTRRPRPRRAKKARKAA